MSRSGLSYLEKTSQDVFGSSIDIPAALDRRCVEVFLAGGTISAGDWVALDTGETGSARAIQVIEAAAVATGNALVIGVALEAVVAGEKVTVVTRGYVEGASVTTGVALGAPLVVDTTAGRADAAAAADVAPPCGVALELAAGNLADVYVYGLSIS
jgi:hypothetical protein